MENRTFSLSSASLTMTAQENQLTLAQGNDVLLTTLTGWDEYATIDIQTAPKLTGAGSYLLSVRAGEREVSATFSFIALSGDVKTALQQAQKACMKGETVTLQRKYYDAASIKREEKLQGLISSVGWERLNNQAQLTINFKILNPVKTIYLNGSSSAEAEGSL